jgi:hypothetical protein
MFVIPEQLSAGARESAAADVIPDDLDQSGAAARG